MRVSRDQYWDAIRRAANGDRRALTEIGTFDALDALKWTTGWREVAPFPLRLDDLMWDLAVLANKAAEDDIESYQNLGHVPTRAPRDTYSMTEDQYWDGIRDLAKHADKRAAMYAWKQPPTEMEASVAWSAEVWELICLHPFVDWTRSLDVLRHTQNLEHALTNPGWEDEKDEIREDWVQKNRKDAIGGLARIAMWEDAHRIWASAGAGYVPNIREDAYWDEIRKVERALPYPMNARRDVGLVRFLADYRDCLDALRLSSNPDAAGDFRWVGDLPIGSRGDLPWESSARAAITVENVLEVAGRAAALADADYLGGMRHAYASSAPPRLTLDQYRAYVVSGARYLAGHRTQTAFEEFFDAGPHGQAGWAGHPLLAWDPNQMDFPYRALDVLYHTDRLEAVWDDQARRAAYVAAIAPPPVAGPSARYGPRREYDQFDEYIGAASANGLARALNWIASAAFCADVFDELGGVSLGGGFTPNIRPDVYWNHVRQMSVRVKYPVDYENDIRWATFISSYDDALDAVRLSSEPGMIGPYLNNIGAIKALDGKLYGPLLGDPDRERTVEELVIVAAKLDAVTDADYWGTHRTAYPTKAPPLMSLDDYLDYVHNAAVAIARDPDPPSEFEQRLNVEATPGMRGVHGHPLIAIPRGAAFPFRTLDVLRHTQHREAIWEGAERRLAFIHQRVPDSSLRDLWKSGFNKACYKSSTEEAFAWLASAAFGADILDELSVMGLSKYAPNEVG